MKAKYQVGIEFDPSGQVKSTNGLIGGREVSQVLNKIKLNKKRNTYLLVKFDKNQSIFEIWKLTKREYKDLHCGFGLTDFGEFLADNGLI